MADANGISNALCELEKALSCPSCGKVQDLQTHVECGGAQCSSCWQQQNAHCPSCRQRVDKKENLWDLGRILALNAERAQVKPDGPVDAFQFLRTLRDYNEECNQNDNENKQQNTQQDKSSQANAGATTTKSPELQEKLVARNSFGGMAFFGGNQSGKANTTGRIGRRRLERQETPKKQESFDDSMFDFHSQSSMPASQASMHATSASQASMHASRENSQQTDQAEQTTNEQADESKTDDTGRQESSQTSQCGNVDSEDQSQSPVARTTETETANDSQRGGCQHELQKDELEIDHAEQQDLPQESQNNAFDSQETRLGPDTCPATTAFDKAGDDTFATEEEASSIVPECSRRRRVTILNPPLMDASDQKASTGVDYHSIVTPASSNRKRQRKGSPAKQSPAKLLATDENEAEAKDLRARFCPMDEDEPMKSGKSTLESVQEASGVGDSDVEDSNEEETCFVTPATRKPTIRDEPESQRSVQSHHSVDSIDIPGSIDFRGLLPPQIDARPSLGGSEPREDSHQMHSSPNRDEFSQPTSGGINICTTEQRGDEHKECLNDDDDETVLEEERDDQHDGSATKAVTESRLKSKEEGANENESMIISSIPLSIVQRGISVASTATSDGTEEPASQGNKGSVQGSRFSFTPTIRSGPQTESQLSVNSQLSLVSHCLPGSNDFQNLMPPPRASQRIRSSSTTEEEIQIQSSPATDSSPNLLASQSSSVLNDHERNEDTAEETGREKSESGELPPTEKDDDEPIDQRYRSENTAKASIDSDVQRMEEQKEYPVPTDTQQTFMSQQLPNTCNFEALFSTDASSAAESEKGGDRYSHVTGDGASEDKALPASAEDPAAATENTSPPGDDKNAGGSTLFAIPAVRKRHDRENKLVGSQHSRPSRHSRSDSEETHLDESQNSLASCMIPATQDLGGLLRPQTRDKTPKFGTPKACTLSVAEQSDAVDDSVHTRSPDDTPGKAATEAGTRSPERGFDSTASDTQHTLVPSQNLPGTCAFQSLFHSDDHGDHKDSTRTPQDAVEEVNSTRDSSKHRHAEESPDPGSSHASLGPERNTVLDSQGSIFSQNLPNTCDFGALLSAERTKLPDEAPAVPSSSHSVELHIVVDDSLEDSDFQRVRRLCAGGVCKADSRISASTTHYVPFTMSQSDPFSSTLVSDQAEVCLPTLEYFQALVLGVHIVDKNWLGEMGAAGKYVDTEDVHRVWGDTRLRQQVIELRNGSTRNQDSFYRSTAWWQEQCGPCQLTPARGTPSLDDYCILVLEQDHYQPPLGPTRDNSPVDLFDISLKDSGPSDAPDSFHHLTKQDMETLCILLGATVVQSEDALVSSDPALTRLVLVPASVPPENFASFAQQRLAKATLTDSKDAVANMPRSQKLWALRSTWLTDSIAARCQAPLDEYSYGVLTLPSRDETVLERFRHPNQNDCSLSEVKNL